MKPIIPVAYFEVTNLFNDMNIVALADAEWYYNFKDPTGQYKNPTVYSSRRTANFGVGFDF
jgi:hypothetical protein